MKTIKSFLMLVVSAVLAVCTTSCGKDSSDEELGHYVEIVKDATKANFYDTYLTMKAKDPNSCALIDYRSAKEYNAEHVAGAINVPATTKNTQSNDDEWCQNLKAAVPDMKTILFLYGNPDVNMTKIAGGRASKIGYGQATRVAAGGFAALKEIGAATE